MKPIEFMFGAMRNEYRGRVAQECLRVAVLNTPDCVMEYFPEHGAERGFGMADSERMAIHAPRPITRGGLFVYLHECAHFALGHLWRRELDGDEAEADDWALAHMPH